MKTLLVLTLILGLFVAGCETSDLKEFEKGNYDGFLITMRSDSRNQVFVNATLNSPSERTYQIDVTSKGLQNPWHIAVNLGKAVTVSVPEVSDAKYDLSPATKGCFESKNPKLWARLCYSHLEVSLDFVNGDTTYTLIIDPQKSDHIPTFEQPAPYTRDQLVDRAVSSSFMSRISFEKLVQAKLDASVSAGNLFPHFSTNTFIGVYTPSITSVLKVIGDLVPFLLPNRWEKAAETSNLFKAQFNGWITSKSDAGNIVDGLCLALLEGEQSIEKLRANQILISQLRDQIRSREKTGILQIGSSDDVTTVMNSIDQALAEINDVQTEGYANLSQASGFINPRAVSQLSMTTDENVIDRPEALDVDQIKRLALERSYELKQVDFLISAARNEKVGSFFSWIDPNASPNGSLGFGFPSYVKIADSEVRELLIEREKIQSIILEKVDNVLSQMDLARKERKIARDSQDIENRRISRYTLNLKIGINFELAGLVTALQGKVKDDLLLTSSGYRYLVALSRLQRLVYAGPYANLSRGNSYLPTFRIESQKNQE